MADEGGLGGAGDGGGDSGYTGVPGQDGGDGRDKEGGGEARERRKKRLQAMLLANPNADIGGVSGIGYSSDGKGDAWQDASGNLGDGTGGKNGYWVNGRWQNPAATRENAQAEVNPGFTTLYPGMPMEGRFMSPKEKRDAGLAGWSEYGYHPNVPTNRNSTMQAKGGGGYADNVRRIAQPLNEISVPPRGYTDTIKKIAAPVSPALSLQPQGALQKFAVLRDMLERMSA